MGADLLMYYGRYGDIRPPRAKMTKPGNIAIYLDEHYRGYRKRGIVKDTPEVRQVLKLMRVDIEDETV